MNRSLVFDLATCAFLAKREEEPLGPGHRPSRHPTGLSRDVSRNACAAG
jgi:hypothetical protein